MRQFLINPFSIDGQFHEIGQVHSSFADIVACLKYIRPLIQENRGVLYCPADIENQFFIAGEAFQVTLNRLKTIDGDIPRFWYQNTKRLPFYATDEVLVTISDQDTPPNSELSLLDRTLANEAIIWISFNGKTLYDSPTLKVSIDEGAEFHVANVRNKKDIAELLPVFSHSEKHGPEPYFDRERKEDVAGMPIRDLIEAGELLRIGISDESDIFSYHRQTKEYFRFKLTRANIYHGFQISEQELPPGMKEKLIG